MSLIARGFAFRKGEIVRAFANFNPMEAETFRVDLQVEPGDVVFVIDDTLSMAEFDLLAHGRNSEGGFTEAHVRALTGSLEEFVVPAIPGRRANDMVFWTKIGRKPGTLRLETDAPSETLSNKLLKRAEESIRRG